MYKSLLLVNFFLFAISPYITLKTLIKCSRYSIYKLWLSYIYIYIYIYMYIYICIYVYVCICMYMYIYMYTYVYAYVYSVRYIYIYISICTKPLWWWRGFLDWIVFMTSLYICITLPAFCLLSTLCVMKYIIWSILIIQQDIFSKSVIFRFLYIYVHIYIWQSYVDAILMTGYFLYNMAKTRGTQPTNIGQDVSLQRPKDVS